MDWRHRAVCRDEDPELFFPIGNTGPALMQSEEAKAVCRRWPVMSECLSWALESGQDAGVWGGLSEDERRALKRRNARARARLAAPLPAAGGAAALLAAPRGTSPDRHDDHRRCPLRIRVRPEVDGPVQLRGHQGVNDLQ